MKTSFRNYAFLLVAMLLILTIVISCGKAPSKSANAPAPMMSIYDTIVKIVTDTGLIGHKVDDFLEIDLFAVPTDSDINIDDLIISYSSYTSAGVDKWLFNFKNDSWDQISVKSGGPAMQVISRGTRSLSRNGFAFSNYISNSNRVRIKGISSLDTNPTWKAYAYGIKFHPGFKPLYRANPEIAWTYNLAHDGTDYWMKLSGGLSRVNNNGEVLFQTPIQASRSYNLVYCDGRFAFSNRYTMITVLGPNFEVEYEFVFSQTFMYGLAWGEGKIWAGARLGRDSTRIFAFNLPDLNSGDKTVEIDTIDVDYRVTINAFDGINLIGGGDRYVYIMTTEGVRIDSISSLNHSIHDMEYQNGVLYISGHNPNGINIGGGFIAPFRYDRTKKPPDRY